MTRLADRLGNIRVRAQALGGRIEGEVRYGDHITLWFEESAYEFLAKQALESALSQMARQLYAGWLRQYFAAIEESNLTVDAADLHDRNFYDERGQVEAVGESSDGRVQFSAVGMRDFSAQISTGTMRELSEDEFCAQAAEAARALIQNFRDQVREIQLRYYG